jgi:CRISPR/Cas system endoribonuclease Cas6 (RAMP superfamily)
MSYECANFNFSLSLSEVLWRNHHCSSDLQRRGESLRDWFHSAIFVFAFLKQTAEAAKTNVISYKISPYYFQQTNERVATPFNLQLFRSLSANR